jgi:hypothetical protein
MLTDNQKDCFYTAFIECALWSTTDESDQALDEKCDIDDLSPELVERLRADCNSFLYRCWFYFENEGKQHTPYTQAGHDFWLTRCGHGAGFWDGDWPTYGGMLTKLSESYGNVDLYIGDDGKIHA